MKDSKKYLLNDYYSVLIENFPFCQIDIVENKLGQSSVRLKCKVNNFKTLDMFIFNNGFAVSYKPNGKSKCYDSLSPKEVSSIVKKILKNYIPF